MKKLDNINAWKMRARRRSSHALAFRRTVVRESENLDHYLDVGADSYAEVRSYFPDLQKYNTGPMATLNTSASVKRR